MAINVFPHLSNANSMRRYAAGFVRALNKITEVRQFGDPQQEVSYYKKYIQYFLRARKANSDPAIILSERFSFLLHALENARSRTVVCHDLITLKRPGLSWTIRKRYEMTLNIMLRKADFVVCVSESTKNDLIEFGGHSIAPRVHAIHNGLEDLWFTFTADTKAVEIAGGRPYFLVVGTDAWYKNFPAVVNAMAQLPREVVLVKVGRISDSSRVLVNAKGLENRFIEVSGVTDAELANLYAKAIALVQPSWIEGFGWPPAEAMAVGCPVIASNRSSLPEVCGDAAMYVDPGDTDALAGAMNEILGNAQKRDEMKKLGKIQASGFHWDETAAKFVSLLGGNAPL